MEEIIGYIPPVTKYIAGSALLITVLCTLHFIEEADLFFDVDQILEKHEIWRVFTSFLYFGTFSFSTFLHLLTLFHHTKTLEVMIFHGQISEFIWFLFICWSMNLLIAPYFNLIFLSESLFMCIMYLLSKRNREGRIALLGLPIVIPNSFLPYLFLAFGIEKEKLVGMAIAHFYYFCEDIVPNLPTSKNFRILKPPQFVKKFARLLEG
jgi:Derlin-2/3